jgi:tetratricopeptide (TPR) repeat protein
MNRHLLTVTLVALTLVAAADGNAQEYREYLARGVVTDTDGNPIEGVEVKAKNRGNYRMYGDTTDKKGKFNVFGMSNGIYDVVYSKDGYQSFEAEWSLTASQTEMKRIDISPVVLMTLEQKNRVETDEAVKQHFDSATAKLDQGDVDGALAEAMAILEKKPDDANANYIAGACLLEKGEIDDSIAYLTRATESREDFTVAELRLAVAYQKNGRIDDALGRYDAALAVEPENIAALYNAGAMLYDAGRSADALSYLGRALELKPDNFNLLEMIGYSELQGGDYAAAYEHLGRARELIDNPDIIASLDAVLEGLRVTVENQRPE